MYKKRAITLIGCSIFCLGILAILYAASPISRDIPRGGFNRSILSNSPAEMTAVIDLTDKYRYIAGTSTSRIFVADYNNPFKLLALDKKLKTKKEIDLQIELDSVKDPRRFVITVDSPNFYMVHGSMPEILHGKVGTWRASRISSSMEYFDGATPISPTSLVVRTYSRSNKGYELAKKSGQNQLTFNYDLLQKQVDGTFCLDGELHYDKELNELVYIHFYRNEFIVADSNLSLKYRGHTIDTLSKAKIKVAEIDNGETTMLSAPPLRVNVTSSVSKKLMFVVSNMLSDNEQMSDFKNRMTLDVYNLKDGAYLHSFYLPLYKNYRASSFKIFDNCAAVIYDKFLVIYELDQTVFSQKNYELIQSNKIKTF